MKKKFLLLAILVIFSLVLGACTPTVEEPTVEEPEVEEPEVEEPEVEEPEVEEPAEIAPLPQGQELANAYAGMYEGTTVTMTGPFTDADAVIFAESVSAFEEATGITIAYEGSKEYYHPLRWRRRARHCGLPTTRFAGCFSCKRAGYRPE